MNAPRHLAPEQVFGYEHQLLTADEVRAVHEHITVCEECRTELARRVDADSMAGDLQRSVTTAPVRRFSPLVVYLGAAAAIVAIVFGIAVRRGDPQVESALRNGRIAVPAFVRELNPPREVLMGSTDPAKNELLAPRGTAVLSTQPTFEWRSLGPEWTYRVHIYDVAGGPVAESPSLSAAQWTVDHPLPAGPTLQWQVTAGHGEERVTLGRPPESPAKFRIADAATAERLETLAGSNPGPLKLAIAYGEAGLIDDARRQLQQEIAQHPGDIARKRLLENLP